MLKKRYQCPHFRILVIGKANAGKTTILEKVCYVDKGTKPIILDKHGKLYKPEPKWKHGFKSLLPKNRFNKPVPSSTSSPVASVTDLTPSLEASVDTYSSPLTNMQSISEGYAWYWAPDYLPWKQLYLPWLSRFWSGCNRGDEHCYEIHWRASC